MLCERKTPKPAVKSLYQCRWHAELDLRNLKTTLGMEMLSCKTPDMAINEIWVHLLAYNLIRRLMQRAALQGDALPRQLSFKHAMQLMLAWKHRGIELDTAESLAILFKLIAQRRVGRRPGRIEPRAVKRRPKPFPWLSVPREIARETVRKTGHAKR